MYVHNFNHDLDVVPVANPEIRLIHSGRSFIPHQGFSIFCLCFLLSFASYDYELRFMDRRLNVVIMSLSTLHLLQSHTSSKPLVWLKVPIDSRFNHWSWVQFVSLPCGFIAVENITRMEMVIAIHQSRESLRDHAQPDHHRHKS